ncbi:rhomboid-like protein [Streptomyces brasiliensis]|uniref:Uncharacterized protein n=1 Tax=Streptomyces brasiliensis TaxID=1954 RepID=A0A917KEU4_9ACTN|nr:rhomboid-like protein [Streptomyces brasiliensis]GGJ11503.1 hypothetical protein GCM10010121_022320 [Streptomyces brasiliensis]
MERTARTTTTSRVRLPDGDAAEADRAAAGAAAAGIAAAVADGGGLLDAMPRQRGAGMGAAPEPAPATRPAPANPAAPRFPRILLLRRLLPTPTATPFAFGFAVLLAFTSLFAAYADPRLVHVLQQGSSTDVAHLVRTPVVVLFASALWIAGGALTPYALGVLVVLAALERRIGGVRAAFVFLLGHVLATLATEVPVGLAVLAGRLPDSSLHRLDYGVSFGLAAAAGALAGLLTPWLRWPLLTVLGAALAGALVAFTDPLTDWGHPIALCVGIGTWPVVRRWQRTAADPPATG